MSGKNPHRPEGKAGVEAWHRRAREGQRSGKRLQRLLPPEKVVHGSFEDDAAPPLRGGWRVRRS